MRDAFRTVDSTIDDENFLAVFKDSGCYLTDLSPEPVDHLNSILREAARQSGEKLLSRKIAQLQPVMIAPLLRALSKHVERSAAHAGWQGQILHLPYPGRWIRHRNAFIETLAPTLRELLLNTTL
jgi:hypothetical protein